MNLIAAKAVALGEASREEFAGTPPEWWKTHVHLPRHWEKTGSRSNWRHRLPHGDTDLRGLGTDGRSAAALPGKNSIPFTASPVVTSGIWLGTAAETTRGLGPGDFTQVESGSRTDTGKMEAGYVRGEVRRICERHDFTPGQGL